MQFLYVSTRVERFIRENKALEVRHLLENSTSGEIPRRILVVFLTRLCSFKLSKG